MNVQRLSLFGIALLFAAALHAQLPQPATTTLARETGNNNLSASPLFTDVYIIPHISSTQTTSNGDVPPANVSKVDTRTLLYPGATTKIYAEMQAWFCHLDANVGTNGLLDPAKSANSCNAPHIDDGNTSDTLAYMTNAVAEMRSRGIQGGILDWNGPGSFSDTSAGFLKQAAEATSGNFEFAIMIDKWAFAGCTSTSTCDSQGQSVVNNVMSRFASSPAYMKTSDGRPVIFFFIDGGTNPSISLLDFTVIHQAAPNAVFLDDGSSMFSVPGLDGAYAWENVNWQFDPAKTGVTFLGDYYSTATSATNASKPSPGAAFKGFNDSLASWCCPNYPSVQPRINFQRCGQTWLNTFKKTNSFYNSSRPLTWLQIVTWDDYEEGSEIETGIDNCVSQVSASIPSGTSTLQWQTIFGPDPDDPTLTGTQETIDHYTVFIDAQGGLVVLQDNLVPGLNQLNLANYTIPPGTYTLYVKAVGKPSILNHMSGPVTYTVSGSSCMVKISSLANNSTVSSPVQVTATATPSVTTATITSMEIDVDNAAVFTAPNVSSVNQSVTISTAGMHTITVKATDSAGASCGSTVTVNVAATQVPNYQNDFTKTSAWLHSIILADGSIPFGDVINPYFADIAAIGYAKDTTRAADVKNWLQWYVNHINCPDANGICGTIDNILVADGSHQAPDSNDSYAATFLSAAWAYSQMGDPGSTSFLAGIKPKIDEIADVLRNPQLLDSTDHLLWAKVGYPGKLLEDNCEVYRGLRDVAALYNNVLGDTVRGGQFSTLADQVQTTLTTQMWDSVNGEFFTVKNGDGTFSHVDWLAWYADAQQNIGATSQLFPIHQGVITPSDSKATTVYSKFNTNQSTWTSRPVAVTNDYPWVSVAYAAALMGDTQRVTTYVNNLETAFINPNFPAGSFWYNAEAGWTMLLATLELGAPPPPPPAVTVSAPANGATVSSPVTITASATGSATITSWHILVDGTEVFTGGQASSISAGVTMTPGTHTVVVEAVDANGRTGSQTLTLTVPTQNGVTVTVTQPPNPTASPVPISASASSTHVITGWHIYVDSVDSFSAGQVNSISASIPMGAGAHTVIVRAWDSTGMFGDQTFTVNVNNPGVQVTVSTPANNAQVNSPVAIAASATSSHAITGWHIYVDSVDSFAAGQVTSISTSLAMSLGTHTVIARAWDSTGSFGDQTRTITVVAEGVQVNVTTPASSTATVDSPVAITANATSANVITGWHVYVDSVDSFAAGQATSISASIPMTVGQHTVIVRAWDSTGAFGDQTLTLTVVSGVSVTVSSPSTNQTVASPFTVNALAISSHVITGWHIYADSVDVFAAGQVSSISASIGGLAAGQHTLVVRAWDSTGAFGDQTIIINVVTGVTVTVSSPANNAIVASPVSINASATSGHVITGWHIYVDGVDSFAAGQVTSISASVAMSVGTHTVIVRAWDSTGAFGDQTLTLNVATGPAVTVSTPANNASVTSPFTVSASATGPRVITGWHIYANSVDVFAAGQVSSINASLSLAAGTYTLIVRAWDSSGAFGDQTLTVTVH